MYIYRLLLPKIKVPLLYYCAKRRYNIGDLVQVPFRNKIVTAIIWESVDQEINIPMKEIEDQTPFPANIGQSMIDFITKSCSYYMSDLGSMAKLALPQDVNQSPIKVAQQHIDHNISDYNISLATLSETQQQAVDDIMRHQKPILLKGVTGSGKTEIYFHIIIEMLKKGKQVLVMLPEIALSAQIISRFKKRFGFDPVIWNSTVTPAKKRQALRGIINGEVKIVIGARSALFLPYQNLGLIVVDEEHDSSYKQSDNVLYHARDMAVLRSHIDNIKLLLVSATPSIESIYNAQKGKYHLLTLESRFQNAAMPNIKIVDMQQEIQKSDQPLAQDVIQAIKANYAKKEQSLIFLNRRGYAPLLLCRACGHKVQCKNCSVSMVVHKSVNKIICHHCGDYQKLFKQCPECEEEGQLIFYGPGIEKIAEDMQKHLPDARIATISRDNALLNNSESENLLESLETGEIDVLIGTQMITKGYHFPNLTLVVVVDADSGFAGASLRACEKTFQLLNQVAGRSGREKNGEVLIQTSMPDGKVIKAIAQGKEEEYLQEEISNRQEFQMPPFARIASITITGKNEANTRRMAQAFVQAAPKSRAKILGPTEALIYKLANKYRHKIMVKADKKFNLQLYLETWLKSCPVPQHFQVKIDIDPQDI